MSGPAAGIRLTHLALIVRDLNTAAPFYERELGLEASGRAILPDEGIRVSFIPVGDTAIELLEPLDPHGAPARFLSARGEGIHHLALEVPDIRAAMSRARSAGLRLIDDAPRPGAGGARIAFVHPRGTHGVLVELVQRPAGRPVLSY